MLQSAVCDMFHVEQSFYDCCCQISNEMVLCCIELGGYKDQENKNVNDIQGFDGKQ